MLQKHRPELPTRAREGFGQRPAVERGVREREQGRRGEGRGVGQGVRDDGSGEDMRDHPRQGRAAGERKGEESGERERVSGRGDDAGGKVRESGDEQTVSTGNDRKCAERHTLFGRSQAKRQATSVGSAAKAARNISNKARGDALRRRRAERKGGKFDGVRARK